MHHAHVKHKEMQMNRYIMEEFYRDPEAFRRGVQARANRERDRAIRAGLAWLGRSLRARFDFRPGHWMERLG
jgi:hypothetical protein